MKEGLESSYYLESRIPTFFLYFLGNYIDDESDS